jgi:hypothetical protein
MGPRLFLHSRKHVWVIPTTLALKLYQLDIEPYDLATTVE